MLGKNADWIRRRWDMRDAIGAARSSVRRRALVVVVVAVAVAVAVAAAVGVSIKRHDEKKGEKNRDGTKKKPGKA